MQYLSTPTMDFKRIVDAIEDYDTDKLEAIGIDTDRYDIMDGIAEELYRRRLLYNCSNLRDYYSNSDNGMRHSFHILSHFICSMYHKVDFITLSEKIEYFYPEKIASNPVYIKSITYEDSLMKFGHRFPNDPRLCYSSINAILSHYFEHEEGFSSEIVSGTLFIRHWDIKIRKAVYFFIRERFAAVKSELLTRL